MDKLKLAHDYVMSYMRSPDCENTTVSSLVSVAWVYADAMQAEAEKRVNKERPEALCEVDWRLAPEWANWWAIRQNSSDALWCVSKPTVTEDCFLSHGGCGVAPSFGFTGSHIMERPDGF